MPDVPGSDHASEAEIAAALDHGHLRTQTFGDAALQREVLDLFAAQSRALLAALEAGTGGAEAAHKLVGSARGIGAPAVAAAAEQVERALLADPSLADPGLGALRRAVVAAQAAIERLARSS